MQSNSSILILFVLALMLAATGTASGMTTVIVNGEVVTVNPDGSFRPAPTLQTGTSTDGNHPHKSDSGMLVNDPNPTGLTVSAPSDNSTTTESFVIVSGSINENATVSVSVNGGPPQLADIIGNNYHATVYLVAGVNTISISATDHAGDTATAKRTVLCTP